MELHFSFCFSKLKVFIFVALMVIALSGEGPDFDVKGLSYQQFRRIIGLNLPVTPFTSDMALLEPSEQSDPFYMVQFKLLIEDKGHKVIEIPWDYFNVYSLKHYITFYFEILGNGYNPPQTLAKLICGNIENETGLTPMAWSVQSYNSVGRHDDSIYQFGKSFPCPL